jgi:hypothetical protein
MSYHFFKNIKDSKNIFSYNYMIKNKIIYLDIKFNLEVIEKSDHFIIL